MSVESWDCAFGLTGTDTVACSFLNANALLVYAVWTSDRFERRQVLDLPGNVRHQEVHRRRIDLRRGQRHRLLVLRIDTTFLLHVAILRRLETSFLLFSQK